MKRIIPFLLALFLLTGCGGTAADGSYQVDDEGHVTQAFGLDSDGDFVNDTGEAIVDGAFQESVLRSAPYFSLRIDGITELNNN